MNKKNPLSNYAIAVTTFFVQIIETLTFMCTTFDSITVDVMVCNMMYLVFNTNVVFLDCNKKEKKFIC